MERKKQKKKTQKTKKQQQNPPPNKLQLLIQILDEFSSSDKVVLPVPFAPLSVHRGTENCSYHLPPTPSTRSRRGVSTPSPSLSRQILPPSKG